MLNLSNPRTSFENYCKDIVDKYVWKKCWHSSVNVGDLTDEELENLALLQNLTQEAHFQYEMISEGEYFDEVVTMLQMYMKDKDPEKGKQLLALMIKNAASYNQGGIEMALQHCLDNYNANDSGYADDLKIESVLIDREIVKNLNSMNSSTWKLTGN